MLRKGIAVVAMLLLSSPVFAQSTPGVDRRQANQDRRVEQGESSGALTPRESGRLERGEAKIRRDEARAKQDGVVTPRERKRLQKEADTMSREIFEEKHDADVAR